MITMLVVGLFIDDVDIVSCKLVGFLSVIYAKGKSTNSIFASQLTGFLDTSYLYLLYYLDLYSAIACVNRMPCDRGPRCKCLFFFYKEGRLIISPRTFKGDSVCLTS